jgi:Flp pilus assembly protein TadD
MASVAKRAAALFLAVFPAWASAGGGPADAQALYRKGLDFGRAGDFARAEELFTQALVIERLHIPSRRGLDLLADRGVGSVDDKTAVLLMNGLTFYADEDWTRAAQEYRKAVERDPGYYFAVHNLAAALYQSGDTEAAIAAFRQALDLKPDYVYSHNDLGLAYARLGQHEKAAEHQRRAIELDPEYYKAYNNLAASLRALGKHEEADTLARKALELNPAYSLAAANLAGWSRSPGPGADRVGADLPTGTLLEILESESWEFRAEAVERLLARNDPESAPRLLELLRNERGELRVAAARLLGGLREPAAFDALVSLLAHDREWVVRFEAAQALTQLQDSRAIPALIEALRSDATPPVRRGVAYGLRAFPGCQVATALRDALCDPVSEVRENAQASLAARSGQDLGTQPGSWARWLAATCSLEGNARRAPRDPE